MRIAFVIFCVAAILVGLVSSAVAPTCVERGGHEVEDCRIVLTCHAADGRAGIDCHFARRCKTRCSLEK
jgi:hypothetical protein